MKTNIYIILLSLFMASCDSFLDVRPKGEVVNNELFEDAEGFEDALYGVYATLADNALYGKNLTYYFNDILAQYFIHDYPGNITLKINTYQYRDAEVRPIVDAIWVDIYKTIGYVNNILINLENFNENDLYYYNVYKAESLALRAFLHFEVLRLFTESIIINPSASGIPYNINYSYEISKFLTAEETYGRIIEELKEAEKLLEQQGEYFSESNQNLHGFLKDRQIHLNLYAIQAIIARVYWTKGDLESASQYITKVIESGHFQLEDKTEIEDLMNGVLSPRETIWGIYSGGLYTSVLNDLYYSRNSNTLHLKAEHEDDYMVDKEGVEYRYESWFLDESTVESTGRRCIKIWDSYERAGRTRAERRIKGLSIIRLPELYYIMAEYYLSKNDQINAIKYMDEVIASRGLTPFAERPGFTLTLEHIIRERKKEFICEGQYFHTLKKFNQDIYESKTGQTFNASNDIYVLPIPDDEINYRN